ncbi:15398_t:CDS:2 [Entrophospora sp. SA101]|nr:4990_t:CDS:2 [Entrophospora sp. SA101]CAJ0747371.1 15398_t:CDS:2 [Entrophospora sp. SA101]CAJ0830426.1 11376_t:CDS:2 [Entrophospora sp. SA101]CAJ0869645.1 11598_t:CDS:2 [Entrophospora sp. SA101]CAJ0913060.1 15918_t:CDS:2 [Entrophospora sp. SA101]
MSLPLTSTSSSPKPTTIEVTDLDLPQLAEVKKQLEEELTHLTSSFAQLTKAQKKFQDCIDGVKTIREENTGELVKSEKVIVDVGTGYYIEKSYGDAIKFYVEKVNYVKENLDKLEKTINSKQNNLKIILDIMQVKIVQSTPTAAAASASSSK